MFNNIQMLRAIAAAMVFFYHADAHYKVLGGGFRFFSAIAGIGFSGVDIFFVISGFVVAHTTLNQANTFNNAWTFARRRLLRIYLGYWPFFALTLALSYIYAPETLAELDLLGSFFLTTIEARRMVVYVAWSLTFELLFYATVTVAYALPATARRRMVQAGAVGIFLLMLLTLSTPHSSVLMFLSFFLEFLAGVMVYLHRQRMTSRKLIWPLILAVSVAFSIGSHLHATNDSVRIFTFGMGALALVTLALVLEQSLALKANKFCVAFGDASYTLYLAHPSLLTVFYFWGIRDFLGGQSAYFREAGFFLFLGLCFWVSRVLYMWMERPIYRWASSPRQTVNVLRP
jgi:peptidoglycan/LPS O-acetylase OafA/YrhL